MCAAQTSPQAIKAGTFRPLDRNAPAGRYAIDEFAKVLGVDRIALRNDLSTAGSHAENAVEVRRVERKRRIEGRRILATLSQTQHYVAAVSRLDAQELERATVPREASEAAEIDEAIRSAALCLKAIRNVLGQRDFIRLPPGGGGDLDRFCTALIERLEIIWMRATGKPAPRGSSGHFVSFVAAAWQDLGLPEFRDSSGRPRDLLSAIGSRVDSRQRKNRPKKNHR